MSMNQRQATIRNTPKLVQVLNKTLLEMENLSDSVERHELINEVACQLTANLATFGPILDKIHQEYEDLLKAAKRNCLIDTILRQRFVIFVLI